MESNEEVTWGWAFLAVVRVVLVAASGMAALEGELDWAILAIAWAIFLTAWDNG